MHIPIIERTRRKGGHARLLGGRAVDFLCGSLVPPELKRESEDIDLYIRRVDRRALRDALAELGCEPMKEFNLRHGSERLMYFSGDTKIDIYVDKFRMCHTLDLRDRIAHSLYTLPPADVLLTKLQIVDLDRKDLIDLAALLLALPLDPDDIRGIDTIYLAQRLGANWELWRTATATLATLRESGPELLPAAGDWRERLIAAIDTLLDVIDDAPKSFAWRFRAIAGERVIWYEKPKELAVRKPKAESVSETRKAE